MFGPHLTLDLSGCDRDKLLDVKFIESILDEFPPMVGLHKLTKPFVRRFNDPTPGVSAFVIISESHVSIHTFGEERFASVDIFSCKDFDKKFAVDYFTKKFNPQKIEKHFLTRGEHYPFEIRKAIQRSVRDRKERKLH